MSQNAHAFNQVISADQHIDDVDRSIIIATQAGLPLTARPYHHVAEQLGLSPQEVMHRLRQMQQRGIIRRIAAVPNHYALGYSANGMSVWDVDDTVVNELGARVGELDFVSHCYRRPRHMPLWPYNLFAMVHARSREEVGQQIDVIAQLLAEHCRGRSLLYSTRILKKTGLRIK